MSTVRLFNMMWTQTKRIRMLSLMAFKEGISALRASSQYFLGPMFGSLI